MVMATIDTYILLLQGNYGHLSYHWWIQQQIGGREGGRKGGRVRERERRKPKPQLTSLGRYPTPYLTLDRILMNW